MDPFNEHVLSDKDGDRSSSSDMERPTTSSTKRRPRGATTMEGLRMDVGGRKSVEPYYNEVGVAINRAAVQMNNLEGSLVRSMIPINIPHWASVSKGLKDNLWDAIQVRKTFLLIVYYESY